MTVQDEYGKDILLIGWAHSRFGKLVEHTMETLIVSVASAAIEAAGLAAADIDAIFLGQFNSGMVPLSFSSSLPLQASADLFGVPATRVENACASGSAAMHQAFTSLLAATAEHVLVIGAEKMTHAANEVVAAALLGGDYDAAGRPSATGFAGLFAEVAQHYDKRFGDSADTLGLIAAKNHRNGVANPYAQIRKDLGVAFCQTVSPQNPLIAPPLRRTDCAPVSDGAAAIVLSRHPSSGAATAPVRVTGFAQANDFLPASKRDPLAFKGSELAWNRALQMADARLEDLSLIELHDCFTIAELNMYEVIGLTERGHGHRALEEGWVYPDGRLPVNVSGGLKSKGHPVGATGVSQYVLAAMQLSGTAGDMQLPGASRAAVHNMGGLAIANYVGVLEAI
jgi:acetyl-CoA C-acetyltransferase